MKSDATDIVEQLETQVVAMQVLLCSKQKQMQDYFKSSPRAPTPTKGETPTCFSPPVPQPPTSEPQPSTSMTTASQPPPKKLKLGLSCPLPKRFKLHHVVDKVMNMSSGSSSVCTSLDSDLESLSSQE